MHFHACPYCRAPFGICPAGLLIQVFANGHNHSLPVSSSKILLVAVRSERLTISHRLYLATAWWKPREVSSWEALHTPSLDFVSWLVDESQTQVALELMR